MASAIKKILIPRAGDIAPQSVAAAGTASSGWIAAKDAPNFIAQVDLGALGGGTVTATLEQANTSGGGGAKALAVSNSQTVASAVDNANFEFDIESSSLDHNNAFAWFRLTLTNVGGTGALVAAVINSGIPRYA